ncbi:leucine-rich repeat-containing protein 71 [Lycodopsis pacificus]
MPKEKADEANAEDEASKHTDEYQCSGKVEIDFPGLCALLDMKDIPTVSTKQAASSTTETEEYTASAAPNWSKACLKVELENEDPLSAMKLRVFGWKVDEQIARVLLKMFPSLDKLQRLEFWQAGLTDQMVTSLKNTVSLCSNLRVVTLEGNHLPEQSYHLLLSEDSVLTHLHLRNNRIGDKGAHLIGLALSTARSANKNLKVLNLAFNCIGDAGATHIAQGLRFNRALRMLSLCNNQIGDSGAAQLAAILSEFALTHEEVVERRKMLLERTQSITAKRDKKPAANKNNPKSNKKLSDIKLTQSKAGEPGELEKPLHAREKGQSVEIVNPLLDQPLQYRDGELFLPGNKALASLNLAGNRITKKSLPLFLTSLEMQGEGQCLLRLCLQRNRFPPECEYYVKIKELMTLRDPEKNSS